MALPERPFENTKPLRVHISRYQTAQVDRNRYSVPRAYVGRWLWAHVGCQKVAVYADQKKVAEHPRIFGNSKWQLDPLHYLDLIEERIGAFEAARPIRQWRREWAPQYEVLLSLLRQRRGDNGGTREFVRILQLHAGYAREQVEGAVAQALESQAVSFEAVKHLLWCQHACARPCSPLEPGLIPGVTDRDWGLMEVVEYNRLLPGGAS
ncbi:hypothetical protein MYX84_13985 [Acidobacteria bacterium AH-259-O06]|nr:hypothetical protein [Acidobacteria bacterium AH-259-O06]